MLDFFPEVIIHHGRGQYNSNQVYTTPARLSDEIIHQTSSQLHAAYQARGHIMDSKALPPFPDLGPTGHLRVATKADLFALIDLEILDDSQLFRYITPYIATYREITARYIEGLARFNLMNPRTLVVVIQNTESQPSPGQPNSGRESIPGAANGVVGMAVWRLPKKSARIGQFVVRGLQTPFTPKQERNLDCDVDPLRNLLCSALMSAGCKEYVHKCKLYPSFEFLLSARGIAMRPTFDTLPFPLSRHRFQEKLCLDKLYVRDAYRNRGYSNALLSWGKTLATQDGVDVGLLAPADTLPYMQKHFFETVRDFPVPPNGEYEGFTYKWCVWHRVKVTKKSKWGWPGWRLKRTKPASRVKNSKKPGVDVPVEWDV